MLPHYLLALFFTYCHASVVDQKFFDEGGCSSGKLSAYSSNAAIGEKASCLAGQEYTGGVCVDVLKPASPPRPMSDSAPTAASCASCAGSDTSSCPPSGTLGIRFGRCYTISEIHGDPITRALPTWYYYYFGTDTANNNLRPLVFRICRNDTQTSCDSPQDDYVLESGYWTMFEQTGILTGGTPSPGKVGFVGTSQYGVDFYLSLSNEETPFYRKPVDFSAKIRCLYGKCSPCLRIHVKTGTAPAANTGLMPTIYAGYGEVVRLIDDPIACFPMLFQETACLPS